MVQAEEAPQGAPALEDRFRLSSPVSSLCKPLTTGRDKPVPYGCPFPARPRAGTRGEPR